MKKDHVIILAAAVGLYLFTRQRGGRGYVASPANTNAKFYQSPAVAGQMQSQPNPGATLAVGVFQTLMDKLKGSGPGAAGTGGPFVLDSSAGEAQAAAVYAANPGSFASPDPFAAYSNDAVAANVSPSQMVPNIGYVDPTEY